MAIRSPRPAPAIALGSAPTELVFCASRRKTLLVFFLSLLFVGGGFFLNTRNELIGWLAIVFGGLGGLACLILALFPRLNSLKLTAEGCATTSLFGSKLIRWHDVAGFEVCSISRNTMVVFNFRPGYDGAKFGRMVARDLSGWEGALADMYGIPPAELADLLNAWKRRSDENESRRE